MAVVAAVDDCFRQVLEDLAWEVFASPDGALDEGLVEREGLVPGLAYEVTWMLAWVMLSSPDSKKISFQGPPSFPSQAHSSFVHGREGSLFPLEQGVSFPGKMAVSCQALKGSSRALASSSQIQTASAQLSKETSLALEPVPSPLVAAPSSSSSLVSLAQGQAFPLVAEAGVDVACLRPQATWGSEAARPFDMTSVGTETKLAQFHDSVVVVALRREHGEHGEHGEHPRFSRNPETYRAVAEEARRLWNDREEAAAAEEEPRWRRGALPCWAPQNHRVRRLRREAHVHCQSLPGQIRFYCRPNLPRAPVHRFASVPEPKHLCLLPAEGSSYPYCPGPRH